MALIGLLQDTATIVAYVMLAARRYTDVFERTRRHRELEIPAELQWQLLPVLAHEGADFVIAGALEPAYDIGGDNFDYAENLGGLTVSITDAMGHGTAAALLCNLEVAVQRNARRRGLGLGAQVHAANRAVHEQFGGEAFLTHLCLRIDRHDGSAVAVNAGHSFLYLMRGDVVEAIAFATDLPIGLFPDTRYVEQAIAFAPGDRLLLISDGILDAAPDGGQPYETDRLVALLLDTTGDHPVEVVRKLTRDVMAHRGAQLLDDATAVCVDYRRR